MQQINILVNHIVKLHSILLTRIQAISANVLNVTVLYYYMRVTII